MIYWKSLSAAILAGALMAMPVSADSVVDHLLTKGFTVYTFDGGVVNHPVPGGRAVVVPTWNLYRGPDGGYVACYSHRSSGAAYRVGDTTYVMGQVRLRGEYDGRIFQPTGYDGKDISAAAKFKRVCRTSLRACSAGGCWAGGDTGGWFGL